MDQSIPARFLAGRAGAASRVMRFTAGGAAAAPGRAQVLQLRLGLILGCAFAIGVATWAGDPGSYQQADPALARLLRGMALIKGLITIGAVSAVYWRLASPAAGKVAAVYVVCSWALAGASALIWQLSYIGWAALLFHLAAVTMLVVGWREK